MNRAIPTLTSLLLSGLCRRFRENAILLLTVFFSVVFLCTTLFGAGTLYASLLDGQQRRYGQANVAIFRAGAEEAELLADNVSLSCLLPCETLYLSVGDEDTHDDDFTVARASEAYIALQRLTPLQGRMPEAVGEIAVEQASLSRLRIENLQVGASISLSLLLYDGEEPLLHQEPTEKQFTLVGILPSREQEGFYSSIPDIFAKIPQAYVWDQEPPVAGSVVYPYLLGVSSMTGRAQYLDPVEEKLEGRGVSVSGIGRFYEGNALWMLGGTSELYLIIVILLSLSLSVAAMAGIGNALTNTVEKRRQQVGLLRAIGATGIQVRKALLGQTLLLGAIATPVGVAFSAALLVFARKLYPDRIVLWLPAWGVIASLLLCFGCVALCGWLPTRKAMRIMPMQAVRDIEKTRVFRTKGWKSQAQYRLPSLLSRRAYAMQGGRLRSLAALVAAGGLLFSLSFLVCSRTVFMLYRDMPAYDFAMQSYFYTQMKDYLREDTVQIGRQFRGLSTSDVYDIASVPCVTDVRYSQRTDTAILLPEASDYITAEGRTEEFSYLYDVPTPAMLFAHEVLAELDEEQRENGYLTSQDLWPIRVDTLEREHAAYLRLREELDWQDSTAVFSDLVGLDMYVLQKLTPYVYDGRINVEKLLTGEEVLVVAPARYTVEMIRDGADCLRRTGEDMRSEHGRVYENDTFRAGQTIQFATMKKQDSSPLPEGKRAQATIGAVLEMPVEEYDQEFPFLYYNTFAVVCSNSAFPSFSIVDMVDTIEIRCTPMEEELHDAISEELALIAQRTSGYTFSDSFARLQNGRERVMIVAGGSSAVLVLLGSLAYAMCMGAITGKLQSEIGQIGTLRAMGASRRVVTACYDRQIARVFLTGLLVSFGLFAVFLACTGEMNLFSLPAALVTAMLLCAPAYSLLLWGLCAATLRRRLRPVFQKSVVENIRVL